MVGDDLADKLVFVAKTYGNKIGNLGNIIFLLQKAIFIVVGF